MLGISSQDSAEKRKLKGISPVRAVSHLKLLVDETVIGKCPNMTLPVGPKSYLPDRCLVLWLIVYPVWAYSTICYIRMKLMHEKH